MDYYRSDILSRLLCYFNFSVFRVRNVGTVFKLVLLCMSYKELTSMSKHNNNIINVSIVEFQFNRDTVTNTLEKTSSTLRHELNTLPTGT